MRGLDCGPRSSKIGDAMRRDTTILVVKGCCCFGFGARYGKPGKCSGALAQGWTCPPQFSDSHFSVVRFRSFRVKPGGHGSVKAIWLMLCVLNEPGMHHMPMSSCLFLGSGADGPYNVDRMILVASVLTVAIAFMLVLESVYSMWSI